MEETIWENSLIISRKVEANLCSPLPSPPPFCGKQQPSHILCSINMNKTFHVHRLKLNPHKNERTSQARKAITSPMIRFNRTLSHQNLFAIVRADLR